MGQGAKFTVANGTNYPLKKVQHESGSYQMNNWNFPETIMPKNSQTVYIEWDESIFHNSDDDQATVVYKLQTGDSSDNLTFKLNAIANPFRIVASANFDTQTQPANTKIDLGWLHNGVMSFGLVGNKDGFIATGFNAASWMENNLALIGSKKLSEISIPGSHDSGMSVIDSSTEFSHDCNTKTQTQDIAHQLNFGTRYFDIRPVIGGGQYYTGHYSHINISIYKGWQGSRGQSISDIITQINAFTNDNKELIVLNLSHAYDTDAGNSNYPPFNADQWNGLLKELSGLKNLYVAKKDETSDFASMTVNDLIANSSKVLVIVDSDIDGINFGANFFPQTSLDPDNDYSDTNDFSEMSNDQLNKMVTQKGIGKYFLLSWTLTQSDLEALCFLDPTDEISSVLDLASEADQNLFSTLFPKITTDSFANIIYTDNVSSSNSALMAMYTNYILSRY